MDERRLSHECRADFPRSVWNLKREEIDIFLGNHAHNNGLLEKIRRIGEGTGENPFLNTNEEWHAFLGRLEQSMIEKILSETPEEMPKDLLL